MSRVLALESLVALAATLSGAVVVDEGHSRRAAAAAKGDDVAAGGRLRTQAEEGAETHSGSGV
eukprot:6949899-Prymnesium_polylepis.1